MKPRIREDLAVVEIDGEAVIYDEESGQLHHLNPTATLILQLCDGEATVKELSVDLAGAYAAPFDEIEKSVRRLVRELKEAGLLESLRRKANGRTA